MHVMGVGMKGGGGGSMGRGEKCEGAKFKIGRVTKLGGGQVTGCKRPYLRMLETFTYDHYHNNCIIIGLYC
jgi:hypothetical protein